MLVYILNIFLMVSDYMHLLKCMMLRVNDGMTWKMVKMHNGCMTNLPFLQNLFLLRCLVSKNLIIFMYKTCSKLTWTVKQTFFIWNLMVALISSTLSVNFSEWVHMVGNLPALLRPGPTRRGICLIRASEAMKASYFFAVEGNKKCKSFGGKRHTDFFFFLLQSELRIIINIIRWFNSSYWHNVQVILYEWRWWESTEM